jgi:hypothetical protein
MFVQFLCASEHQGGLHRPVSLHKVFARHLNNFVTPGSATCMAIENKEETLHNMMHADFFALFIVSTTLQMQHLHCPKLQLAQSVPFMAFEKIQHAE